MAADVVDVVAVSHFSGYFSLRMFFFSVSLMHYKIGKLSDCTRDS
jgi:hypothetical protein